MSEIVANSIKDKIFTIRGKQVMLDRDLAELYEVETKRLNEQVKRNIDRFPSSFRFELTLDEKHELVAICDRLQSMKHSSVLPYVFTEQGVAMLSSVLNTKIAINVSIQIMNAFVDMRKFLINNAEIFSRLANLEQKQLQTDTKVEKIFKALDSDIKPKQGIFFDGQIFDAYKFFADLIRKAKKSIVIIDNFIDYRVFAMLAKRQKDVKVTILTKNITKELLVDLRKYNAQYPKIEIKEFRKSHDRFLILDDSEVYLIGSSLKDLGSKWFGFSKIEMESFEIIEKIKELS